MFIVQRVLFRPNSCQQWSTKRAHVCM